MHSHLSCLVGSIQYEPRVLWSGLGYGHRFTLSLGVFFPPVFSPSFSLCCPSIFLLALSHHRINMLMSFQFKKKYTYVNKTCDFALSLTFDNLPVLPLSRLPKACVFTIVAPLSTIDSVLLCTTSQSTFAKFHKHLFIHIATPSLVLSTWKTRIQFKRQNVYLGSRNYSWRYTDISTNSNSLLIKGEGIRVFSQEKEEDEVSCFFRSVHWYKMI